MSKYSENVPSASRILEINGVSRAFKAMLDLSSKLPEDSLAKKSQMFVTSFPKGTCHHQLIIAKLEVLEFTEIN